MDAQINEFYSNEVLTATDGKKFFVGIDLKRCSHAPNALDEATIDIAITDGQRAWKGEKLTELDLGTTLPDRMRHALEALVHLQPPTEEYIIKITPQPLSGTTDVTTSHTVDLLVEIEWDNRRHGKDTMSRVHFLLKSSLEPAKDIILWLMGKMVNACGGLKTETEEVDAACKAQQQSTAALHRRLEEYANRKEKLDEDAALKGAALLVAKEEELKGLKEDDEEIDEEMEYN